MSYDDLRPSMTALDILPRMPALLPRVQVFNFLVYRPRPTVSERRDMGEALDLNGLLGTRNSNPITAVTARELGAGRLEELRGTLSEDEALGLCSICTSTGGRVLHLPMMDFHVAVREESKTAIVAALKALGRKRGLLLDSGRSYHFLGLELLSEHDFVAFLGGCLLLDGLVDGRYIGHRLIEMNAVLRLTASRVKPKVPELLTLL